MSVFEPYEINWCGRDYVIPADQILRAIAVVEQHVTLHELMEVMAKRQTVKMGTMAAAYAALLRFVGVKTTDDEVYASFFNTGDGADTIISAVRGLQMLMIPPSSFKPDPAGKSPDEKRAAARSSKKHSRRPAAL